MLKYIFSVLLIASLCILPCEAKTPWISKPPLGSQIDWGHSLSKGLVGCWLMNEKGGSIIQDLAKRNDGLLINSPTWQTGVVVQSNFKVNGTNQSADINRPVVRDGSFSCAFITYRTSGGSDVIYTNSQVTNGSWRIDTSGGNTMRWTKGNVVNIDTNVLTYTTYWEFWILTYNHANGAWIYKRKFLDRVPAGVAQYTTISGTNTQGFVAGDNKAAIGRRDTSYYTFSIAYLNVWDRPLSPSEVQQLYQEPYCFIKSPEPWYTTAIAAARRIFMIQ